VIGSGRWGFGMAILAAARGFEVTGCDVSAEAVARFVADGGKGAKTPAEAAKNADIVVSVVVNATQTETILFGAKWRQRNPSQGRRVRFFRHHGPRRRAAAGKNNWKASGRHYLDAPISAARSALRRASSPFWPPAVPRRSQRRGRRSMPWRQKLYELGDAAGEGAAFKMINQLLAGVHIAAASEAIAFAAKQGLDIRKVYEVITAFRRQFLDVRKPHAACARRRLCATQRGGEFL